MKKIKNPRGIVFELTPESIKEHLEEMDKIYAAQIKQLENDEEE